MAWNDLLSGTTVVGASYFLTGGQGATLASADSIAVTDSFHEVSGSTTVNTISGGTAGMGLFLYRPVGASWALGTAGNIKASSASPTARVMLLVTPDGTTWYGDSQGVSVASASNDIVVAESGGTYTLTFTPANISLDEFVGPLAITKGGTGQITATAGFDALAPTTTTGDIIYFNGTDNVRLGVGASGYVLIGGTNPAWSNTPIAGGGWHVGDANNGMVSIGSNNIAWKINNTTELDLNASRLAPVTNLGLELGDADQFWGNAYFQDERGWRLATLSATPGANTIATIPVADATAVGFVIEAFCFSTGTGTNYGFRSDARHIIALAKGTTITSASTSGPTGGINSTVGTYNFSAFTITVADAGSNVLNIVATPTVSAGTATDFLLRYKLRFLYGDPVVTELL